MIEAWSTEQVYAAEAALMATLPQGELMARAVRGLAAVAAARLQDRGGRRVVALVGPGNNGADALYAVATLAEEGFEAIALHQPGSVHSGAWEAAERAGVRLATDAAVLAGADLVLDGVVGIGGRPGLPRTARDWVAAVPDTAYVMAVDLPSGQDPAGLVLDPEGVFADETVTFSVAKPVHLLPATEAACGLLTVVDIGLELTAAPAVRRLTRVDIGTLWPVPGHRDDKYTRGVVGIIAGSETYPGAAVLAVTAAVEAGAGMVRYLGPPTPTALVRAAAPEAVTVPGRVQAWVVGPGLDTESTHPADLAQVEQTRAALASDLPVVVDAGGLDLVTGVREVPTLLTPHAGECARLLTRLRGADGPEMTRGQVERQPVQAARELTQRTRCDVLLKGATTVIVGADSELPVSSQADAPAWLATAGAGDVLAGLIGVLLAAELGPMVAGSLGALVHGAAADDASRGGPLRALSVARAVPDVVARSLHR